MQTALNHYKSLCKELEQENKILRDALEKATKEIEFVYGKECSRSLSDGEHDWEPNTTMNIMRCENCGIGANTFALFEALAQLKTSEPMLERR